MPTDQAVARSEWEHRESRVVRNTHRLLEMFDSAGIHATFFTLGWVAERFPALVRPAAQVGMAWFRRWDRRVAARIDRFIANSTASSIVFVTRASTSACFSSVNTCMSFRYVVNVGMGSRLFHIASSSSVR